MSGYYQGETLQPLAMINWASAIYPDFPKMTELNLGSTYGGNYGTWVTLFEETSGGPWLVMVVRVHPTISSGSCQYRITVDGSLLTSGGVWHAPTGTNHFIGMPFGSETADCYAPVFARSSFKVEVYNANSSSYSQWAYVGYSVS